MAKPSVKSILKRATRFLEGSKYLIVVTEEALLGETSLNMVGVGCLLSSRIKRASKQAPPSSTLGANKIVSNYQDIYSKAPSTIR